MAYSSPSRVYEWSDSAVEEGRSAAESRTEDADGREASELDAAFLRWHKARIAVAELEDPDAGERSVLDFIVGLALTPVGNTEPCSRCIPDQTGSTAVRRLRRSEPGC